MLAKRQTDGQQTHQRQKTLTLSLTLNLFSNCFFNIMKDTLTWLQKTSTKQFFFRRMSMTSQTYLRRRIQRFARNFVF
jgi:hypothetical protein